MTAYPVTCLVDCEDGYRTTITIERGTDADAEQDIIARLIVSTDDGKEHRIGLSPEAVHALIKELRRIERGAR